MWYQPINPVVITVVYFLYIYQHFFGYKLNLDLSTCMLIQIDQLRGYIHHIYME